MADDDGVTTGTEEEAVVDTATSPLYRFLRALTHGLNRLLFRTTVEGREHVPRSGPVIVAPVHRSFVDFFIASEVTGRKLHYMAKDNLWKHPRAGRFLLSVGAFPVHRGAADREALRRAQRVLEAGEVLVLFPEGTRRSGPVVEDLHEGVAFLAARTGATVVPVGIGGSSSVMPKGSRLPRPRHVHVVVGEPLPPVERAASGRVPRSQLRAATVRLREAVQELYDCSVERTGRY